MCNERWLPIPGYEESYQVSSLGRFRRVGKSRGATPGRDLSLNRLSTKGYIVIELSQDDQKKRFLAHRLVALTFLGCPTTEANCVNHKDGCKTNNRVENLEWVTRQENNKHAALMGLLRPCAGSKNGRSKLSPSDVEQIRSMKGVLSQRKIANRFAVSRTLVQRIHQGILWRKELIEEWPEDLRIRELPTAETGAIAEVSK